MGLQVASTADVEEMQRKLCDIPSGTHAGAKHVAATADGMIDAAQLLEALKVSRILADDASILSLFRKLLINTGATGVAEAVEGIASAATLGRCNSNSSLLNGGGGTAAGGGGAAMGGIGVPDTTTVDDDDDCVVMSRLARCLRSSSAAGGGGSGGGGGGGGGGADGAGGDDGMNKGKRVAFHFPETAAALFEEAQVGRLRSFVSSRFVGAEMKERQGTSLSS